MIFIKNTIYISPVEEPVRLRAAAAEHTVTERATRSARAVRRRERAAVGRAYTTVMDTGPEAATCVWW